MASKTLFLERTLYGCLRLPGSFGTPSSLNFVRNASKKSGGSTKRQGKRQIAKHLGAKRGQGEHVIPGTVLYRQRGYRFHPGENVGAGRDHTLYALVEGKVKYSRELLEPYPWALGKSGQYHERKFIHVIGKPFVPKYVLVNKHDFAK